MKLDAARGLYIKLFTHNGNCKKDLIKKINKQFTEDLHNSAKVTLLTCEASNSSWGNTIKLTDRLAFLWDEIGEETLKKPWADFLEAGYDVTLQRYVNDDAYNSFEWSIELTPSKEPKFSVSRWFE